MSVDTLMLQVAIRCKPFTASDQLGIICRQTGESTAEVETINGQRQLRLPFSYAWWSAYGYEKKIKDFLRKHYPIKKFHDCLGPKGVQLKFKFQLSKSLSNLN